MSVPLNLAVICAMHVNDLAAELTDDGKRRAVDRLRVRAREATDPSIADYFARAAAALEVRFGSGFFLLTICYKREFVRAGGLVSGAGSLS